MSRITDRTPIFIGVLIAAIVIGTVLVFWANAIEEGYVINKGHNSAYTTTDCSGKICTTTYHPETWSLELSKDGDTGWKTVSYSTWIEYEIGEYYPSPR